MTSGLFGFSTAFAVRSLADVDRDAAVSIAAAARSIAAAAAVIAAVDVDANWFTTCVPAASSARSDVMSPVSFTPRV